MRNHYNSDGKSFEPRILYQDKLPIKCESRIETFLYLFIYFIFYFFGGKEPLLCFGCWQPGMGVEVADACPKGNSPPTPLLWQSGDKSFYRWREGATCRTAQSALTVTLKLVISGLTSVILIVISTINLQFQGWFVSIEFYLIYFLYSRFSLVIYFIHISV